MSGRARIERSEVRRVELPDQGAAHARARWGARPSWVVRLHAEGEVGLGEATPLPGYSPDPPAEVEAALADLPLAGVELDLDRPLESAIAIARALPVPSSSGRARAPGGGGAVPPPSARFAVESAVLDLAGRLLGEPTARLLAPALRPGPRPVAEVLTGLVVGAPEEQVVEEARALIQAGVRAAKLKVGAAGGWARELRVVRAVRAGVPELGLRLDANQGLGADAAERLLDLSGLRIAWVEEPSSPERWPALDAGFPPFALDESLTRPDAAARLERLAPTLAAVVLKPAVLGGIGATLAWAERARALGVPAVLSHLFDGHVAARAYRALAWALPPGPAHGLGVRRGGGPAVPEPRGAGLGPESLPSGGTGGTDR